MKHINLNLKLFLIVMVAAFTITGCNDEPEVQEPLAYFTFSADADNSQLINFTNETENGETYLWDFGDGETSTEISPSHEYADAGTFTVTLTATNEGGDNIYSEDIDVLSSAPVNVLLNGELNDDSNWIVIQMNPNNNGSATFEDGVLVFNEVVDIAEGGWGEAWAHVGIYQSVSLEAGTYFFDMDVITEGINETWCEVWIGDVEPLPEDDYNTDDGAQRIAMINSWDCASTITYSGPLSDSNCMDQTLTLDAGTYYVCVRSGGFNFGPNGITVDNLFLAKN